VSGSTTFGKVQASKHEQKRCEQETVDSSFLTSFFAGPSASRSVDDFLTTSFEVGPCKSSPGATSVDVGWTGVFFSVESPFELATHVDTARRELLVDDPPADRDDLDDFLLDHRTMDRRDERLTGISVTVVTTIVVVCSTLSSAIAPRGGGGGSLVHVALSPLGVGVGGFFVLSASAATASVGNVVATTTTVGILQSTLSHEASAVLSSPLAFASQSSTGASGSGVSDGLVASASSPGAVGERGAVVEAAAPTPASCSDGLGRPFVWS
jgi:hypothetical protein